MAGSILITIDKKGMLNVDYNGNHNSLFGFNDVDILRSVMTLEAMFCTQTGMATEDMREIIDEERESSKIISVKEKK